MQIRGQSICLMEPSLTRNQPPGKWNSTAVKHARGKFVPRNVHGLDGTMRGSPLDDDFTISYTSLLDERKQHILPDFHLRATLSASHSNTAAFSFCAENVRYRTFNLGRQPGDSDAGVNFKEAEFRKVDKKVSHSNRVAYTAFKSQ
uniref:Uncharacterized protein n=1 Tax=Salix viminalis TaxID=40686 RepID=A0A6N2LKW1_SALVM